MKKPPETAMVLAAGLGTRLRPLTDTRPKALVEVAGRSLIDRALDRLVAAGVNRAVVNLHHHAETLRYHLAGRRDIDIVCSDESRELLDTGGGVAKALSLLGSAPFLVVNADALWFDGTRNTLHRLAEAWDGRRMEALMLMHPTVQAVGYDGRGDYHMAPTGRLRRRNHSEVVPFLFAGVQILSPKLFADGPTGAFSLNRIYDQAEGRRRLFGCRHLGIWMHVGSPAGLAEAEAALAAL
ncbi:MAG TPA: nucleotidyltransferase family protein [Alphaproteobacteria bacterium]|jgi:MurNAc alpha-1-phosphate uridylyltransferase|nr:nucleotidyltransferase family protein [Alphaproteobacteria bacterium]HJP20050.1 nucleotidyltransferase family protein [Alphaproteobacteria bacterium]